MKNYLLLISLAILLMMAMELRSVHGVSVAGNVVWTKKEASARQIDRMLNDIDKRTKVLGVSFLMFIQSQILKGSKTRRNAF